MKDKIWKNKKTLKSIIDKIADEVMILDTNYRIIDVNKSFCDKNNVSKEEVLGKNCFEITHGLTEICKTSEHNCPVKGVINSGKCCRTIHTHYINNKPCYIDQLAFPIQNESGQIKNVVKIGRDTTEKIEFKQRVKESEGKFQNLIENFPYPMLLLDINQKIYDCSSITELYLNKSKAELIGKNFTNLFLINKSKNNKIERIIENVIDYGLSEIIELDYNIDNQINWIQIFFTPLQIKKKKYIQVIIQDITEQKLAEKIIREENRKLRNLDQVKNHLAIKTSKELKIPLKSLYEASHILLNEYKDKLDKRASKLLELIEKDGERSINLVKEISGIAKIDTEKYEIKKQVESINQILINSIECLINELITPQPIIHLHITEDFYSELNKYQIELVFKNLIAWVIINSSEDDKVTINLYKDEDYAEISIKHKSIKMNNKNNKEFPLKRDSLNKFTFVNKRNNLLDLKEPSINLHYLENILKEYRGQIIINSQENSKKQKILIRLPIINVEKSLIHIYIFHISGIPLYDYKFKFSSEIDKEYDSTIITGGLIGLMTILKQIIRGNEHIKMIDHGDRIIIFQTNKTHEVVFALVVKGYLTIMKQKLEKLIDEFDSKFQNLIQNLNSSLNESYKWKEAEILIKNHFE